MNSRMWPIYGSRLASSLALIDRSVVLCTVSRRRRAHYLINAHPPFWRNLDVSTPCPSQCPPTNIWLQTGSYMAKYFLIMEYLSIHWDLTKFLLLKWTNSFILCATCVLCVWHHHFLCWCWLIMWEIWNLTQMGAYKVINKRPCPGKRSPFFSKKS